MEHNKLTAGELRKMLEGVSDDTEVVIYAADFGIGDYATHEIGEAYVSKSGRFMLVPGDFVRE